MKQPIALDVFSSAPANGVDHYQDARAEFSFDRLDVGDDFAQVGVGGAEIDAHRDGAEGQGVIGRINTVVSAPGMKAQMNAVTALGRQIDNETLSDLAAAPLPAERDVQR
jgi:hypothetical protein